MGVTRFTDDLNIIAALGDNPNTDNSLTAEGLKKKFDEAGIIIQKFINDVLLPAIESGGGVITESFVQEIVKEYIQTNPEIATSTAAVRFTLPAGRALGDVNGDGLVDDSDATLILRYTVGKAEITDEDALWAADVNGDGEIDAKDATLILKYSTGDSTEYPAAEKSGLWLWDYENSCYYYDVAVEGMTAEYSAMVMPGISIADGILTAAQCIDGKLRITAKSVPTEAILCSAVYDTKGGTSLIVNRGSGTPVVKNAVAGQFLSVGAVDANGRMTSVVPVTSPVKVAEDGYTDIEGLRKATAIANVKADSTITMTVTLQGDAASTSVVITLDENGYPATIVTDGTECAVTWEGF